LNQPPKPLNVELCRDFVKANDHVKIITDQGQIDDIEAGSVKAPSNSVVLMQTSEFIARPSLESQVEFKRVIPSLDALDLKVLPELVFEPNEFGEQHAYRILFTSLRPLTYDFESKIFFLNTWVSFGRRSSDS